MFETDGEFEDEVRRIARLLWPSAEFGGAEIVEGRERDGVFETEEFVHVIECTVSRSKDKAIRDCEKIEKLIRRLAPRHAPKFIRGWFITRDEPTADQRAVVAKAQGRVNASSFDQFRSRLVDARSYLTQREKYAFGSVRDPETGRQDHKLAYTALDIVDDLGKSYDIHYVAQLLLAGEHVALTGDYGAGKSSTSRELFFALAKRFWTNSTSQFPIALNLRDHHGQTDPVEALERHARQVGFGSPSSLVRAWRGGFVVLLLDGFDEIASAGWAGRSARLRDLRYRSMELVRRFVKDSPRTTGILLTGRAHFFDNPREMRDALALRGASRLLALGEFSQDQVRAFLATLGWTGPLPEWLPTRPLLLAYLASRGLLSRTLEVEANAGPAVGWDELLQRIAERESEIEAGIDPKTVRRLIEHLATLARSTVDGLGPIAATAITESFVAVCGYAPDDKGAVLLQRLPGLGGSQAEDGSRVFIDRDFAEAARAGTIFEYIENPYAAELHPETWHTTLRPLGADVAAHRAQQAGYEGGKLIAALQCAYGDARQHTLCADLLLVLNASSESFVGQQIYLRGVPVDELRLDDIETDFHLVEFQDCILGILELAPDVPARHLPRFTRCYIARVEARTGESDLPADRFVDCTIDEFENTTKTTNAILSLSIPLSTRVLLTVLKKVYAQSGNGRKESALFRGLDLRAQQLVPEVLQLLKREDLITRSRQGDDAIWLPVRGGDARRRVLSMLAAPAASTDPALAASRHLET